MSGSVSKTRIPRYPIRSFRGGLNSAILSYYVQDDEIVEAKNVEITFSGSIAPRLGLIRYDDVTSQYFTDSQELRNAYRYVQGDGSDELVVQGNSNIYVDGANTIFTTLSMPHTMSSSDDGLTRIQQWRDVLYFYSENAAASSYNRGANPLTRKASVSGFYNGFDPMFVFGITDGVLEKGTDIHYYYRFTFERYHGDIFVGESMPIHYRNGGIIRYSDEGNFTINGGFNFVVNVDNSLTNIDDDIRFINFYRTDGLTEAQDLNVTERQPLRGYFFLGQIDADDYRNASAGDILFVDDGSVELATREVFYNHFSFPPKAKFAKVHKSRMWLANITGGDYGNGSGVDTFPNTINIDSAPSRVFHSELLDPEKFRVTSFFDVGRDDGEPITAMEIFENRFLVIFKANSMWGIFGGDVENAPGVIDIEKDVIDDSVGCIAPESVAYGEGGLIFLSNKGVYVFSGTKPVSMRSEFIDDILANISPSRKINATGIYTQDRKYILSFTDTTQNENANTVALQFDFVTKTWTRNIFGNSTIYGVNKYIEAKKSDEAGQVYTVLNTTDSSVGAIQKMNLVQYEVDIIEGVPWSFKTKHFDCGSPDIIKFFKTIIFGLKMTSTVTVNYDIDDGCTTGTLSLTPIDCAGNVAQAAINLWDDVGLNWLASAGQDLTHIWNSIGESGGFGAQQNYVINVATAATPNPKGRRIQFEFSSTATIQGQEFQGLTILYTTEERVSNA